MDKHTFPRNSDRIRIPRPSPGAGISLICCPHAGASARVFGPLARALPADVEVLSVEYPGRQGHPGYHGFSDIAELAGGIARDLAGDPRPAAVLGHSMGSVIAFELTRALEAAGRPPLRLFVSGRRSPSEGLGPHVPQGDEAIVAELRELGAVPPRLLDHPRFRESILTVVRNDYAANSRYRVAPDARVAAPVTFLLADSDPYVDAEGALGWARHTAGGLTTVPFPGGHFFLDEQLRAVVATITGHLSPAAAADRGGRR